MSLLGNLIHGLIGQHQKPQQQAAQIPPDITYDPTGRTPYSARTPELAKLGNQYVANPTSPQFLGVDPAQFGFPADNTVRPKNITLNGSIGQSLLSPLQNLPQGGQFNPGGTIGQGGFQNQIMPNMPDFTVQQPGRGRIKLR